jgi:hypothetical protein
MWRPPGLNPGKSLYTYVFRDELKRHLGTHRDLLSIKFLIYLVSAYMFPSSGTCVVAILVSDL